MGHTLKLSYGATTVNLTTGVYRISRNGYVPKTPRTGRDTVSETATIFIDAASVSALQTAVRDIEETFELAKQRRLTQMGDRVYVEFLQDGGSVTYRSELYASKEDAIPGRVNIDERWMQDVHWSDQVIRTQIVWERRSYWEGLLTELSLRNNSGTGTGGRTITNPHAGSIFSASTVSFAASNRISDSGSGFGIFTVNDMINLRGSTSNDGIYTVSAVDGGGAYIDVHQTVSNEAVGDPIKIYDIQNYVHIDSTSLIGNKPSPIELRATNTDAGGYNLETLWAYANYNSNPDEFPHILEAEDSDTGSDTVSAFCSGEYYRAYTVTTTEAKITGWDLPSQLLEAGNGAYFRVLMRTFNTNGLEAIKFRLRLYYGTANLFYGTQLEYDDTYADTDMKWRELDSMQLPPIREAGTPKSLNLQLWCVSTSGSSETLNLDALMLMPTDSYRKYKSLSSIAQNSVLYDDPILDVVYQEISSERLADTIAFGSGIWGIPGKDLRIYFCQHTEDDDIAERDRTMSIRCYYRPRITTI